MTPAGSLTPEEMAMIVELIPSGLSIREIAAVVGRDFTTVRMHLVPIMEVLRASGDPPLCQCGKPRFHRYGCAAKAPTVEFPGHPAHRFEELRARRSLAVALLTAGYGYRQVDAALNASHGTAKGYMRFLTAEQLDERRRAVEARPARWEQAA